MLKSAAAALPLGAVASAATGRARGADYRTVEVPAGQTHDINLGSGDTLEDVLIDVTAEGASVSIRASGDGWAIRNVGVKGEINVESPKKIFVPSVSEGGSAVVENFYLGDGTGLDSASRLGGVWVNANTPHEGELVFRKVNVGNWADNGLYGSGPGAQEGPDAGTVKIEQSYAHNNNISGFRIGTNGSYVRDSTIVVDEPVSPVPAGTNARGIYMKEGATMTVENCDISMGGPDGTAAVIAVDGAEAIVKDCEIDGSLTGDITEQENVGSDPDTSAPAGVPLTAEEAAAGISSASGGDTESSDTSSEPAYDKTLRVETEQGGPLVEYELTVDGSVRKAGDAETNDTVTDNGDGTVTIEGVTGNGYADNYEFTGSLVDWGASVDPEHYRVLVDGSEVQKTDDTSEEQHSLTVETEEGGPLVEYQITVDGSAEKGDGAEDNDSVTDNGDGTVTIEGITGNGYTDTYTVTGSVTDVTANVDDGAYRVLVDGSEVTA